MDAVAQSGGYKKRRMEPVEVKAEYMIDPHVLELLIVRWFTSDSIPLSTVESDDFRAVMAYINRDIGAWLPSSGNTIKNWIICHFVAEKAKKISSMAKARSLIYVSCDMAVSSNGLPIMVWMAHYIDESGDLIVAPLAVREIQGSHDQDNLAKHSMEVLIEWGIAERIGYWVMDTAKPQANKPSKNTYVAHLQRKQQAKTTLDEYSLYLSTPPILECEKHDPRKWWLDMAITYPKLHRMALDMLSIPAMSSECERLFSATKVTITDRRNRIGIELVEAHECLKY